MQNKNEVNNNNDDNNICLKCGICCDGTLFFWAKIFEGETIDNNLEMKLIQIKEKNIVGLALPCSYLKDCACSIYYSSNPQRPLICKRFKCKLLKRYEKQDILYENALIIIQETKALVTNFDKEIKNYFLDIASESISIKLNKLDEKHNQSLDQIAFRKKNGKVLLDSFVIKMMFSKHFIKTKLIAKGSDI